MKARALRCGQVSGLLVLEQTTRLTGGYDLKETNCLIKNRYLDRGTMFYRKENDSPISTFLVKLSFHKTVYVFLYKMSKIEA